MSLQHRIILSVTVLLSVTFMTDAQTIFSGKTACGQIHIVNGENEFGAADVTGHPVSSLLTGKSCERKELHVHGIKAVGVPLLVGGNLDNLLKGLVEFLFDDGIRLGIKV